MTQDNDIIIPCKDLSRAIPDCLDHVADLLKTAKHLHDNNKFDHAIMCTVLGYEELNKLAVLLDRQRRFEDITKKTMHDLSNHRYKLTQILTFELKREANWENFFNITSQNTVLHELNHLRDYFQTLNFVKQMAMYYDYRGNRSITLKHQIQGDNLGHFSFILQSFVYLHFNREMLFHRFGNSSGLITAPKEDVMKSDEWKNQAHHTKNLSSSSTELSRMKFWNTLIEIKSLYEYLKIHKMIM